MVAELDDITESYEWGCFDSDVSGADGLDIGTGLQNSLDIVEGCSDTNCAAYMSLNAVKEGYTDWYLPSRYKLSEMSNTIGSGGSQGNIGSFENNHYWSSSESSNTKAWAVLFNWGSPSKRGKTNSHRVRVIRDF